MNNGLNENTSYVSKDVNDTPIQEVTQQEDNTIETTSSILPLTLSYQIQSVVKESVALVAEDNKEDNRQDDIDDDYDEYYEEDFEDYVSEGKENTIKSNNSEYLQNTLSLSEELVKSTVVEVLEGKGKQYEY